MNNFEYIKHLASLKLEEFSQKVEPRCTMCAYCESHVCTVQEDPQKTCQDGFKLWLESEATINE